MQQSNKNKALALKNVGYLGGHWLAQSQTLISLHWTQAVIRKAQSVSSKSRCEISLDDCVKLTHAVHKTVCKMAK